MKPVLLALASFLALLALTSVPASAATVSYIDGNAVWLASTDGTKHHKLAGATSDGRVWFEQTQSDNGRVLAVRREPGKIAPLNSFTLWGPDRSVVFQGFLTGEPGWTSYAYPVSLDLTADGRNVIYGYANTRGFYPNAQFEFGTYVIYADRTWATEPFSISDAEFPTVVGDRIVAAAGAEAYVQDAGQTAPFGYDFQFWVNTAGSGLDLGRTDVSATGKVAAAELTNRSDGPLVESKIAMLPFASLGGSLLSGDCFLPAQGFASDPSISQDGQRVAWHDDRGVVVAGVPDFSGAEPCNLTSPPVVISATGKMPSIGAAELPKTGTGPGPDPDPGPGPGPGPGGGGSGTAPKLIAPARIPANSLKKGFQVKVKVAGAGQVKVVGRVSGKKVATGKAKAKKAGKVTVVLKATRAWRSKLSRIAGKKISLKVSAGGKTSTVKVKVR